MQKSSLALAAVFASYVLPAAAQQPTDQLRYSERTLKGLVTTGYQIVAYSSSHDPVSNALRAEFILQLKGSVYLCSDIFRYKSATREIACYELVEPYPAKGR